MVTFPVVSEWVLAKVLIGLYENSHFVIGLKGKTRHREAVEKHGETTAPRTKENTNARDRCFLYTSKITEVSK